MKPLRRLAGFRPTKTNKRWHVCWGRVLTAEEFAGVHEFQRVNHFPGGISRLYTTHIVFLNSNEYCYYTVGVAHLGQDRHTGMMPNGMMG